MLLIILYERIVSSVICWVWSVIRGTIDVNNYRLSCLNGLLNLVVGEVVPKKRGRLVVELVGISLWYSWGEKRRYFLFVRHYV